MAKLLIEQLRIEEKDNCLVNLSFEIKKSTALIGQSGSGKSLTLKSILGMLPTNLTVTLQTKCDFVLSKENIAFVPQNPFTSLSPMTKIGDQFFCSLQRKIELLNLVDLEPWVLERFSNQLSGGQLQRVIIAIALIKSPKLLLLDEPTTALDSKNKTLIIELIKTLQAKLDFLILFVTHDIHSIKHLCEEVIIIKNGTIIEIGVCNNIFAAPQHEYTKTLILSGFENRDFRK